MRIILILKKISGKPVVYIPLSLLTIALIAVVFFIGRSVLFHGAFFNSVMACLHETLGNIGIVIPSTDGGKWNGIYSLDLTFGKCTGSAATEVDINAQIQQVLKGKYAGLTVYNSRITVYKDGFIDANGKATSTYSKSGVNLTLEYQFQDVNGIPAYSGTYRMWDINPYIEFDCNGGISGVKK